MWQKDVAIPYLQNAKPTKNIYELNRMCQDADRENASTGKISTGRNINKRLILSQGAPRPMGFKG